MTLDELLKSHPDLPIPEADVAQAFGWHRRKLQRMNAERVGPPRMKIGKHVFYRAGAVREWMLAHEQEQPRANGRA